MKSYYEISSNQSQRINVPEQGKQLGLLGITLDIHKQKTEDQGHLKP